MHQPQQPMYQFYSCWYYSEGECTLAVVQIHSLPMYARVSHHHVFFQSAFQIGMRLLLFIAIIIADEARLTCNFLLFLFIHFLI